MRRDTFREGPELLAAVEPELPETFQLTEPFGEWQVRHEQKSRVNLLAVIPCRSHTRRAWSVWRFC